MTFPALPSKGSEDWFPWARAVHAASSAAVAAADVAEIARDAVGAALTEGSNVVITKNDAANTITIASTGTSGGSSLTSDTARLEGSGVDATGASASTTAMQTLLQNLWSAGKRRVLVPEGTYLLNGALNTTGMDGLELSGVPGRTTLKLTNNTSPGLLLYASQPSGQAFRDLIIDSGTQASTQTGTRFETPVSLLIERCKFVNGKGPITISNASGDGANTIIRYNDFGTVTDFAVHASDGTPTNFDVHDNRVSAVLRGVELGPAAFLVSGKGRRVYRNRVVSSIDTGVMVVTGTDVLVENNNLATTQVSVFIGTGTVRARVLGNDLSSIKDFGVHALNDPDATAPLGQSVIEGNTIHDCGKSGVQIEGFPDCLVMGNIIERCGQADYEPPNTTTPVQDLARCGVGVQNGPGNNGISSDRTVIIGNIIRENSTTPKMRYGVYVQPPIAGAMIRGNTVTGVTIARYSLEQTLTAPFTVETDTKTITSSRPSVVSTRLYRTSDLTLTAAVSDVPLNGLDFNHAAGRMTYNLATGKITVLEAGSYLISSEIFVYPTTAGGVIFGLVRVNGNTKRVTGFSALANADARPTGSSVVDLAANDVVSLGVYQSGTVSNVSGQNIYDTGLTVTYLGALT